MSNIIKYFWKMLHWLTSHRMYYIAVVVYHIAICLALIIFTLIMSLPTLYLAVTKTFDWINYYRKQGVIKLKKGIK